MTYEATLIVETELPINFTVSNTVGIEKGALLQLTDPMTASAVTANDNIIAGIAAEEKIALDGVTKLAVYRGGIFKMTISGAAMIGEAMAACLPANQVRRLTTTVSGARIVGTILETADTTETALVELNIQAVHNA